MLLLLNDETHKSPELKWVFFKLFHTSCNTTFGKNCLYMHDHMSP